jgi:O-antigen/teichoic acid export membrane protein
MSHSDSRATFFRQSGWMAFAAMGGGVFNLLASLVVFKMGAEVNAFDTALAALAILGMPALGIQAAFATQAAVAERQDQIDTLAATMRSTYWWIGCGWLVVSGLCFAFSDQIMRLYNLNNPAVLWVFLAMVLVTLWSPIPNGVLQGRQDFLWFGAGTLLNGAGRFAALAAAVYVFKLGSLGSLIGALTGSLAVLLLVAGRTLQIARHPGGKTDWNNFLRRAVPLTFGLGALVLLMQADALIVREKLQAQMTDAETVGYTAARRIGQVLVFVVGAIVAVMYPKVARGLKSAEGSDALRLTVALTAIISVVGAIVTSVIPQFPLRILAGGNASPESAKLVVAYVWALAPLAISNVLVWNLMARERFRTVPVLMLIAGGCWFALRAFSDRLLTVVTVVGIFSTTMMVVSGILTILDYRKNRKAPVASAINA